MTWQWDSGSHNKIQTKNAGIKKLQDEWVWQPVKLGPAGQYGSHQVGELLEEEAYPRGFCSGTGEKPKGSKCSVCKGKGMLSVEPPAVRCAFCKGRGEEKPRTNVTCTACRGKGIIHVEEPIEICQHCRGTGKEPTNKLICITCRGKGVVTVKEEELDTNGASFEEISQGKLEEEPVRSASGSERDALETVGQLGQVDKIAVAKKMSPPVSSGYAEQLCNALVGKGLLTRDRVLYSLTPNGEKALGNFRGV
jgi:RecJ-like exonuclease